MWTWASKLDKLFVSYSLVSVKIYSQQLNVWAQVLTHFKSQDPQKKPLGGQMLQKKKTKRKKSKYSFKRQITDNFYFCCDDFPLRCQFPPGERTLT